MDDLLTIDGGTLADQAEVAMLQETQEDCPVVHHFGPGVYMREVSIRAGVFSIGHRQTMPHQNILLKGSVQMFSEDGTRGEVLQAPLMFVGGPGRKVGLILEDMVWLNVYPNPTNEQDIDTLEAMFLDKSTAWKDADHKRHMLETAKREIDRLDYRGMLDDVGVSHEVALAQSGYHGDLIHMPPGYSVRVMSSPIEGLGLFATTPFKAGDVIAPARINDKRTPAGRYTNHSATPNARMVREGHCINLVAARDIDGCKGGQPGEEITIDYRQAVALVRSECQELTV